MDAELSLLRFKKLDPKAVLPTRGSVLSAGLDIYSTEDLTIAPGERYLARTGLSVAIPEGYYGRLAPRSGLAANKGLDTRSEEHTSELQSRLHLVCRLLLEKKKKNKTQHQRLD